MKAEIKKEQEMTTPENIQVEIKETEEVTHVYTLSKLDRIILTHENEISRLGEDLANFKKKRELVLEEVEKVKVNK